ncbi:MAG: hypothetical protein PHX94_08350, partial [Bacteroidales bacterium]|nr:hypothetical protein [Bacteroidales bacterium]
MGQTHSLPSFGLSVGWSGLAMCAMWVGFLSFFAGGRKKQNKFPSNLHCPVKKLNPFYFQFITIVSVWSSVFLHLLPTDWRYVFVADFEALPCQVTRMFIKCRKAETRTVSAIKYTAC